MSICMSICDCTSHLTCGESIIVQGTTPTLTLSLPMDFSQEWDLRLAVKCDLNSVFVLTNNDMSIVPNDCGCTIAVKFTQEQTFAMKKAINIQLRAKHTATNEVVGTTEVAIDIARCLDSEVM